MSTSQEETNTITNTENEVIFNNALQEETPNIETIHINPDYVFSLLNAEEQTYINNLMAMEIERWNISANI
jgi:hypothetical protein